MVKKTVDFKDLEVKILSWIIQLGLKCNYNCPYEGGRGRSDCRRGEAHVTMEQGLEQCSLTMEKGAKAKLPAGKGPGNGFSLQSSQREPAKWAP